MFSPFRAETSFHSSLQFGNARNRKTFQEEKDDQVTSKKTGNKPENFRSGLSDKHHQND
jgi:hypothetical protein